METTAATIDLLEPARSLWARGAADNNAGRPADAARLLRGALTELDRVEGIEGGPGAAASLLELRCKTLITFGLTQFLLSGLAAAQVVFDQAQSVVDELGDPDLRARLDYQRANVHGRAGDLAGAWAGIEGAARHLDGFAPQEQCSVHLSRGMLALELLRPERALESFSLVAQLAHERGFTAEEFMARHNEGYAAYLLGDLPRALALMAEAEEIAVDVSRGPARLDRGQVLLEAGLVSEAVDVLESGMAGLDGEGQALLLAEYELTLARANRVAGQYDRARAAAESAQRAFVGLGAQAWAARAALAGLVVDLDRPAPTVRPRDATHPITTPPATHPALIESTTSADSSLARAGATAAVADALIDTAVRLGDRDLAAAARTIAGEALLATGDLAAARDRLDAARRQRPGSLADALRGDAVLAEVRAAAGEAGAARRMLSRSAKRLAAGQQGSASLDLRTARSVHGVRLAALDLELAVPHGSTAVLATLERWRGATEHLPSLGRPDDPLLAELTETLRSARAQLRGETDPQRVRDLERQATSLERQIRARDWALGNEAAGSDPAPVRIRDARDALTRADCDLVWFFVHEARICGVGIIGGRPVLRDLMAVDEATEAAHRVRVDLRTAASLRLGSLGAAVWGSLRSSAARLDEALVRPWRSGAGGLVIVTCPQLSALPWSLLPSLGGHPVTIARSLTSFAVAEESVARSSSAPLPVHVSVGPAVHRAEAEASAIAEAWGGRASVASPSASAVLVQALSRPGVVHVAAHGTHQVESPLFSSLAMHDGPVFAHELQPTGVHADHVVLSACDVGLATSRPGNEELGLAVSMLSLGARSAVAAIAPMPDDVAADVMTRHHRALAAGASSDAALATAIAASDPVASAFLNLGGRFTA